MSGIRSKKAARISSRCANFNLGGEIKPREIGLHTLVHPARKEALG